VSLEDAAFLVLAAVTLFLALAALLSRELVHTIMWIAGFFVALAAIYFLLEATFLGVLQLGVYAGAVTILLLFGVMVTRKQIFRREAATGIGPASITLAVLVVLLLATVVATLGAASAPPTLSAYPPQMLSATLFNDDGPWLLLLGLVMLSALGGGIYLVREGRE
jgi:NADH:ubiquinone oxidoreductase subunit 6 (subunit J)